MCLYRYNKFNQAGIAECQILLALEPEAAALYCKNLPDRMLTEAFNPGTKYMVLDMGGRNVFFKLLYSEFYDFKKYIDRYL